MLVFALQLAVFGRAAGHFWAQRGRDTQGSSAVPYAVPTDLSVTPAWVWDNELDEQVRHSPLIDDEWGIYVTTGTRIRKFSDGGALLWTWRCPEAAGKMSASPALYDGRVIAYSQWHSCYDGSCDDIDNHVHTFAIDMRTGGGVWNRTKKVMASLDANSVFVADGTVVVPAGQAGTTLLIAMNSSDGSDLWEYRSEDVIWNFAASSTNDGYLLFSASCGAVHCLRLRDGTRRWRVGESFPENVMCGGGGGALGPNGVFYSEYAEPGPPGNIPWPYSTMPMADQMGMPIGGHISAYAVDDGTLLWTRTLDLPGLQYPAVGHLSDSRLAVVVAMGHNPYFPWPNQTWPTQDPMGPAADPPQGNEVVAFDASSGEEIWRWKEQAWPYLVSAGDQDRFAERYARAQADPRTDTICWPDPQGIPVIAGDGTVYASSSHGGDLTAMRDANGDGVIGSDEVSAFHTGIGFLNSPSLAPGMLVAAPCWGPVYVFKSAAQKAPRHSHRFSLVVLVSIVVCVVLAFLLPLKRWVSTSLIKAKREPTSQDHSLSLQVSLEHVHGDC